jgi:hypothetical protein
MVSETVVVLVVEENAVYRSITAERLRVAGFEVVEAANFAGGAGSEKRRGGCIVLIRTPLMTSRARTPADRSIWAPAQVSVCLHLSGPVTTGICSKAR